MRRALITFIFGFATAWCNQAMAVTTTANLGVQMAVTASCAIGSVGALSFGTSGLLTTAVDATTTLGVQCTTGTTYNVGLNAGTGAGATVAARTMSNGASTLVYTLYSKSARTTVWGNTVNTDTVSGAGTGSVQTYTVYGRAPAQTTPAAGVYSDTVTVTVTY
jgi:spore coat protein U-like protein